MYQTNNGARPALLISLMFTGITRKNINSELGSNKHFVTVVSSMHDTYYKTRKGQPMDQYLMWFTCKQGKVFLKEEQLFTSLFARLLFDRFFLLYPPGDAPFIGVLKTKVVGFQDVQMGKNVSQKLMAQHCSLQVKTN